MRIKTSPLPFSNFFNCATTSCLQSFTQPQFSLFKLSPSLIAVRATLHVTSLSLPMNRRDLNPTLWCLQQFMKLKYREFRQLAPFNCRMCCILPAAQSRGPDTRSVFPQLPLAEERLIFADDGKRSIKETSPSLF